MKMGRFFVFAIACWGFLSGIGLAQDWPQWRCDAGHSGFSSGELPEDLQVQWTRSFGPRSQAWVSPLNRYLMQYDKQFEPVVMDGIMVLAFNDSDKVVGIDVETGRTRWTYFTDGPVRLAPALWNGKAYISCDDGVLYCLSLSSGTLEWSFRAVPDRSKALGNQRLISMWPLRGGAVVEDGRVYFSAGIWPFMGVFIYCLDANDGDIVWVNDCSSYAYRNQPHHKPAFGGIAPQGVLALADGLVLAPGGRSVPGAFDKQTGEELYYKFSKYNKGYGGDFVAVKNGCHYTRRRRGNTQIFEVWKNITGEPVKGRVLKGPPVLADSLVYAGCSKFVEAFPLGESGSVVGEEPTWRTEIDASGDLICSGERVYAGGTNCVFGLDSSSGKFLWKKKIPGVVERLLAAEKRLFVVTSSGEIISFGAGVVAKPLKEKSSQALTVTPALENDVERIKFLAQLDDGYALIVGIGEADLIQGLVKETAYRYVVVDPSSNKVSRLRSVLDDCGVYGDRIAVHCADPKEFALPPYLMSLIVFNRSQGALSKDLAKKLAAGLRPYGGVMLATGQRAEKALKGQRAVFMAEDYRVFDTPKGFLVFRPTAPHGAGSWTHNYGDIAQTAKSDDTLVRAPLAPLWWGGEAPNTDVLPRHGHGPAEQVLNGRLIIQGVNCISARDVYTGRLLWKREIPGLNKSGVYYNKSYNPDPLVMGSNQRHIPGAETRGANFVVARDATYVVRDAECLVLDITTGKTKNIFRFPDNSEWGYIGIKDNFLIAGSGLVGLSNLELRDSYDKKKHKKILLGKKNYEKSCSKKLIVMNRHTGKILWGVDSRYGFLNNGIVVSEDSLFCLDRYPYYIEKYFLVRGLDTPSDYYLKAFDLKTGRPKWSANRDVFGTFLSYSAKHNLLVESLRSSHDGPLQPKNKSQIAVFRADDGSRVWKKSLNYGTFPIIHNDLLITDSGAWNISDGSPLLVTNTISGEVENWAGFDIVKGCGYPIASENLLTYRSSSASFYNLDKFDGTASLGGFKSGCSATLIAADGVLNSPDYTFTCSCSFQNQASLALIHSPDVDYWSAYHFPRFHDRREDIQNYALNFGAPGDRGTGELIWANYPNADDTGRPLPVSVNSNCNWIVNSPFLFGEQELDWVFASCAENIESLELAKAKAYSEDSSYTVSLYFAELGHARSGERLFDVWINDNKVLSKLDVFSQSGAGHRGITKTFSGLDCSEGLKLSFKPQPGSLPAIISGIKISRE